MNKQQAPGVDELWVQHQRRNHKTTQSWACIHCLDRRIFSNSDDLWQHCLHDHKNKLPEDESEHRRYRTKFEAESVKKIRRVQATALRKWKTFNAGADPTRYSAKDDYQPRKPAFNEARNAQPEPMPSQMKRPLSSPAPTQSISSLRELNIGTPGGSEEIGMMNVSEDSHERDQPRKRAAVGDGISAGSASPARETSASPLPRRSKARPTSAPGPGGSAIDSQQPSMFDAQRPQHNGKKQLWNPDQDTPLPRGTFDPSNIASIQAQKSRQALQNKSRKPQFQQSPQTMGSRPPSAQTALNTTPSAIYGKLASTQSQATSRDDSFDIMLQPETRPISQEQLVAEVKGIYAGLVMVEAKCIDVDNKQAALAAADTGATPPKLNNEQWQALIALHRTLLHEHHDFFLASQHPSASPALRRLASKYAMPARMWRHGIHSFLELLRHRLPASLDHMLAFIYLAYSMMALLYETVPAFEDTWIECLGDLGRYRMAIEDDDIRDREVWTGVARHWYSKASDKTPTTGRLYHHLAILARPNALQQLFYYSKSLCVAVPFTSARESILTLFEPVLNSDNAHGQYRLPPLDTAFVMAHGILFTNRDMHKFESTVKDFLGLLDNQIGRVTRKFMEQGYHIAVANNVAMLSFTSNDNVLMKLISQSTKDGECPDVSMEGGIPDVSAQSMAYFKNAQHLSNETTEIVLQRIGDPNVLPFIHVTLVFIYFMSRRRGTMSFLQATFPWVALSTMLNTLLSSYSTPGRIEDDNFPSPEKDDTRPFPEDFAMRGLLWAEEYFPEEWFTKEKIDEEEKYHERPSMTAQRKERILWLACKICSLGPCIAYDGKSFFVPSNDQDLPSRASTFASATTASTRTGTWESQAADESDVEEDLSSPTMPTTAEPFHDD
ncbi:EST/SMG-like protein [Lachnellula hyalina]|uniref:Nonsense-mediated mRNA decay factor n=1 Tax=Lachnellula hyalina TaxID=1316788 RepID=A0A8H8QZQ0_9HELO|nr:EST/SMG-like protein [Lachnellula hyalina]TVY25709.1 EST/SMG-like protein [Lachnellula hyalina]